MKIAWDFDATQANTPEVWLKLAHDMYGVDVPKMHTMRLWDWTKFLPITREELMGIFTECYSKKHMKYVAPMDSSFKKWAHQIIAEGHEVYVLTANPSESEPMIRFWLAKYDLDLPIVFVKTVEEKMAHEWDILVDDAPAAMDAHRATNSIVPDGRHLVVYDNPWNQDRALGVNQYRVYNWQNVADTIRRIEPTVRMYKNRLVAA